jgi:hypothetical protein
MSVTALPNPGEGSVKKEGKRSHVTAGVSEMLREELCSMRGKTRLRLPL